MDKINREYVESLPLKEANMGGVRKSVRYDENAGKIYGLDDRGRWNGTVLDVQTAVAPKPEQTDTPVPQKPEKVPNAKETENTETEPLKTQRDLPAEPTKPTPEPTAPGDIFSEDEIVSEMPDENGELKNKPSFIKRILFVLLAVALIVVIIMTFIGGKIGSQEPNNTVGLESTQSTTLPESTEAPTVTASEPAEESTAPTETEPEAMISVLAPNHALIPGQLLTAEQFEIREITEDDYRVLSASAGLYTVDELDELQGLVAVNYIPAGKYLAYDDVGRSFGSVNPWEGEYAGYQYIVLPVTPTPENLTYFNWASTVSLTITVQTKQTNDNTAQEDEGEETTPDGMEHESSVLEAMVIDTYRLSDVRIADLQNIAGESLFPRYYSIASIPSAFQREYLNNAYQDADRLLMDIPAYIVICVTEAQYAQLSGLSQESMTVEVSKPVFVSGSALQNETYALLRDTETVIAEAWILVEGENDNAATAPAQ